MPSSTSIKASCGYLAAALNLVGFGLYFFEAFRGHVDTNPVTWYLWLLETFVSLTLYSSYTEKPSVWAAEAASLVGVILFCLYLTFEVVVNKKEVGWANVELIDWVTSLAVVIVYAIWLRMKDRPQWKKYSLVLFQVVLLAVAVPLIRSAAMHPHAEPFWPWAVWTVSFSLQALCAWLFQKNDGVALANPVNYALTHGIVAVLAFGGVAF